MVRIVTFVFPYAFLLSTACEAPAKRSDDGSLQSLQALVQQQAATIQQQAAQLQAVQDRQTVQDNQLNQLRTLVAKTAAFSVTFSSAQTLNIGDNAAIRYDNVITNIGGSYDTVTGVFTAPFSGVYAFYTNLRADIHHGWISVGIFKGNTMLTLASPEGSEDSYDKSSAFATTHLNQGDRVYVKHVGGDTFLESGLLTTFSGVLVSPD